MEMIIIHNFTPQRRNVSDQEKIFREFHYYIYSRLHIIYSYILNHILRKTHVFYWYNKWINLICLTIHYERTKCMSLQYLSTLPRSRMHNKTHFKDYYSYKLCCEFSYITSRKKFINCYISLLNAQWISIFLITLVLYKCSSISDKVWTNRLC